jgi:hypothetical protein
LARFWIDANVLIQAKNGPYSFAFNKSFWIWLDGQLGKGNIVAPKRVYDEIVRNEDPGDQLTKWVKNRREKGLCLKPSKEVQEALRSIVDQVWSQYAQAPALEFSRGADPWLIAHALQDNGVVVTHESARQPQAKHRVLIPNVCSDFNLKCIDTYEMLKLLKAQL